MPDLIDLIYQTALDSRKWPQLIQHLTEEISVQKNIAAGDLLPDENSDSLHNHFQRALQVNKRIRDLESRSNSLSNSLNVINLPVMLINAQKQVLESNQKAKNWLKNHDTINVQQNTLYFHKAQFQTQFDNAFKLCQTEHAMQTLRLLESDQHDISLNIMCFEAEELTQETFLILFASQTLTNLPSIENIQKTFNLTPSESELTHLVASGLNSKNIAEKMHISYHTCRTHLKNIYLKTNTHSQAELSYKVFSHCISVSDTVPNTFQHTYRHVDHQMRLSDGRTLSFAEYGPIQGDTVFYMHTIIGSRKQIHPDFDLLYKYNIRMILPERPSVGLSDPQPNRTLHDWPKDLRELANYLHITRFSAIGFQMGAEYALVCGQYFPQQLVSLHLIGMRTPPEIVSPYPDPFPMSRMMSTLARIAPKLLHMVFKIVKKCFIAQPKQHLKELVMLSCPEDKRLLEDDRLMAIFVEGTLENGRIYTGDAIIQELQIIQKNWQIDFEHIESQVHIWHSRYDPQLPFAPVKEMIPHFKHCQQHIYDDDCVMLAVHRWPDILQSLRKDFDRLDQK